MSNPTDNNKLFRCQMHHVLHTHAGSKYVCTMYEVPVDRSNVGISKNVCKFRSHHGDSMSRTLPFLFEPEEST